MLQWRLMSCFPPCGPIVLLENWITCMPFFARPGVALSIASGILIGQNSWDVQWYVRRNRLHFLVHEQMQLCSPFTHRISLVLLPLRDWSV
jgi:hypothetical protein